MSFKFCPKILGERGQAAFPVSNCVLSNFTSWMTAARVVFALVVSSYFNFNSRLVLASDVQIISTGARAHSTVVCGCSAQAYVICGFGGLIWVLPLRKTLVLMCAYSQ